MLFSFQGYIDASDEIISYLPLSHIAAQMLDMHGPMATGCRIYFAQPDALKGSLGDTLRDVRPTIFFGVPRVWEKIYGEFCERCGGRYVLDGSGILLTYPSLS